MKIKHLTENLHSAGNLIKYENSTYKAKSIGNIRTNSWGSSKPKLSCGIANTNFIEIFGVKLQFVIELLSLTS